MNENAGGLGSASLQTFHAPCLSASQTKEGSHHTAPLVKNCAPYYPRFGQAAEYLFPLAASANQIKQPSLAPALPIQITVHHCLSRNLQHDFPPAHLHLLCRPDNAGYAHYLPGIAFHQPATQPLIEGD